MKAIVVTDQAAGTAGMKLVERPEPHGAALASLSGANYGDVVVEVTAMSLLRFMRRDSLGMCSRGLRPGLIASAVTGHLRSPATSWPEWPVLSYGTTGLSVGQRVFGLTDWTRDGTLAEYVAVEARNLAPLPGDVNFTVGAALVMPGLTAWQGLFEHGRLEAGQSVLVH
jgi:NADPH:quinone reductase-like Zn-dependent oxidoreductase